MSITSLEYVINDLRKKQNQTMIGVMTVFLTVSFITFIGSLSHLSPIIVLKASITSTGDFDLIMTKHMGGIPIVSNNVSYYR